MKFSNELKSQLIQCGQLQEFEKANRICAQGDYRPLEKFIEAYGRDIFRCCASLSHSKYNKRKNIERRFTDKVEHSRASFITLTFKPSVLERTSEETRHRYVARFLKSQCLQYVANIDYGTKNEREHYHALVMTKELNNHVDLKGWEKYGFIKVQPVRASSKDTKKVSQYVAKLSQHALKNSGRMQRFIWSRGIKSFDEYLDDLLPF